MDHLPGIDISDFNYPLPPEKIAQFPLSGRDQSKLLVYRDGKISDDRFYNVDAYLPEGSLLIYNKTKVIQARLQFRKDTGALIEVFCLEPVEPTREIQQAFEQKSGVVWQCLVGNSSKWKTGELIHTIEHGGGKVVLKASRTGRNGGQSLVKFTWEPASISFSEVLERTGIMPLPPYMKRESEASDKVRYQTIYASSEGSVAAPTAGLHFTPQVFGKLKEKSIMIREVTLHVGAGTFKPVASRQVEDHEMHTEQVLVHRDTIEAILNRGNSPLIAVGTTTLRTLESLYWFGVKAIVQRDRSPLIDVSQWDPYKPEFKISHSLEQVLGEVISIMDEHGLDLITGHTQLMIVPGYTVRIPDILITNFHMPKSTLLLLVSAFIGDGWKQVYQHALANDYRFLSYGDSCLFFKAPAS